MGEQKTLILIDGHALAFRQYYALERTNMQTKQKTPTWAVFGFFKAIFDLLKNETLNVDAIGVAFDVSHHTFRTEKYEEYKSNREAMPDSMQVQMELIYEGLKAFNIPIYTKEGFEADDVIGTISKRACDLGHRVLILTGDQDAFQLVRKNGCVKVIIPSKGELLEYDWDKVYEKLGVYPNQVIDYKALRGDTSDNIPGIRGIGEKTAVKLLSEFQTVDNVLDKVDEIESKSIREKVKNGIEDAKLSKYLATIDQNVELNFDFDKTNLELPNIATVTDYFRKMQFYSFLRNIEFILKSFNKQNDDTIFQELPLLEIQTTAPNGQLGLFAQAVQTEVNKEKFKSEFHLITDEAKLSKMIDELSKQSIISIRSFLQYKNAVDFELFGIGFGINNNFQFNNEKIEINEKNNYAKNFYIPFVHKIEEKQLSKDKVFSKLKNILENENIKKITHDTKIEANIFHNFGINFGGVIFDTMFASYIKDTNSPNNFDIQCMERINHMLPTMVTDNKKVSLKDYSADNLKKYADDVMTSVFELAKYWIKHLDKNEFKILNDIEIPLAYVLSSMEYEGVCIDKDYLVNLTDDYNEQLQKLEARIFELADNTFNINSPKQVAYILFEQLKLKIGRKRRTGKNKNSTGAEILSILAQKHEIAQDILDYRTFSKLKSTYTDALPALISKKDNLIHTSYNQTATTTGRLSSSAPNLQNIPTRTEEGNKIRQAFIPKNKDYLILSADYSQIELRILAHVCNDKHLIKNIKLGMDVHSYTASKIFDVPLEKVTKDMRRKSKAVNFGIVYGQTKYGLAKALKIKPEQAKKIIDKYFKTYPKIKDYMENTHEFVEKNGYVETIFKRKRYLDSEINSPNVMVREFAKRAAINHPIQGSASDLIKIAMIDFYKKLKENNLKSKMIMQVHDELVVEVEKSELEIVKKLILESMGLNQPLRVPLEIDINVGESWKES